MSRLNYKEYQKLIGDRIKQYRVNAGISQKDLENESGVSVRSISRLEQGASVQLESLIKILTALNLDANLDLLISLPLLTNFVNGAITELQLKNNYNKRNETPI